MPKLYAPSYFLILSSRKMEDTLISYFYLSPYAVDFSNVKLLFVVDDIKMRIDKKVLI